jgi:hypothetical protein
MRFWLGIVFLTGCGSRENLAVENAAISHLTFVTAMAELAHATTHTLDGAMDASARSAILARVGVEPQDLLTFVEVYGDDVTFMLAVWDEVARETRQLATQSAVPERPPS